MEYRQLGPSGLSVSTIGLGCAPMGADPKLWGPVDDNESVAALHEAIDLGITLIDTSPAYGQGHSETIVGKALQASSRQKLIIATQCGPRLGPDGQLRYDLDPTSITRQCHESLRRLRTDTIDIYFCCGPDPATPLQKTAQTLARLLEQGLIRAVGLSGFSCQDMTRWRQHCPLHAVQLPLNLLDRHATDALVPYCQEYGIGVLACSPLARGTLTASTEPPTPHRQPPQHPATSRLIATMTRLAERYAKTLTQLAINWVANFPGVTAAVVGLKRPSQVRQAAGSAGWRLSQSDHDQLIHSLAEPD